MAEQRFPNNSGMALSRGERPVKREEQIEAPKTKKVISGTAGKIKKPLGKKIQETFIQGDITEVARHIVQDIIIPSAIDTIREMGYNLIDGMLYGEDTPSARRSRRRNRERTSIDRGTGRGRAEQRHNRRSLYFDDVTVDTWEEADMVIAELQECITDYDRPAKVTDLYSAVGWDSQIDYTTDSYGWYDLKGVRPIQVRVDGETKWAINLPKAEPLER